MITESFIFLRDLVLSLKKPMIVADDGVRCNVVRPMNLKAL